MEAGNPNTSIKILQSHLQQDFNSEISTTVTEQFCAEKKKKKATGKKLNLLHVQKIQKYQQQEIQRLGNSWYLLPRFVTQNAIFEDILLLCLAGKSPADQLQTQKVSMSTNNITLQFGNMKSKGNDKKL